ncbi:hypothetical protein [Halonotius sp. GCM10025705]|uniref:hypothetical protein n=1 Tax=Halonotius sp. GCM10025705 TaxID=3252678 RepID=UPI003619487E
MITNQPRVEYVVDHLNRGHKFPYFFFNAMFNGVNNEEVKPSLAVFGQFFMLFKDAVVVWLPNSELSISSLLTRSRLIPVYAGFNFNFV